MILHYLGTFKQTKLMPIIFKGQFFLLAYYTQNYETCKNKCGTEELHDGKDWCWTLSGSGNGWDYCFPEGSLICYTVEGKLSTCIDGKNSKLHSFNYI